MKMAVSGQEHVEHFVAKAERKVTGSTFDVVSKRKVKADARLQEGGEGGRKPRWMTEMTFSSQPLMRTGRGRDGEVLASGGSKLDRVIDYFVPMREIII